MSAFYGLATTAEIATGTSAKTLLQIVAPSNHRVKVVAWGIYFDGTSSTAEPILVRLLRQTTAGTMTSLTPTKLDDSLSETLQVTAQHTATAEPTAGDVLKRVEVHPQSGYEEHCPYGQEYIVGGGDRIGIETTAPATANAVAWVKFEE
jgi:hypothetical protein